jgi:hypothetical protein
MTARTARFGSLVVALGLLTACEGALDEGPFGARGHGPGIHPDDPAVDDATAAPVRRLANDELASAIETLTGTRPPSLDALPGDVADTRSLFFPGLAAHQPQVRVESWLAIVDEAAAATTPARIASLAPVCASRADATCAAALIDALGHRAYRRPVSDDERTALLGLYDAAGDHADGLAQIIRAILLSPSFLYVVERGTVVEGSTDLFVLGDTEIATRLALALTDDVPDGELLAAAEGGALHTPEQIRAQAERIFATEGGRRTVERFFDHWLGLSEVAGLTRDAASYPEFDAALNASMLAETRTFVGYEVWEAHAPLADLFRADFSFVDARLGALYGLDVSSDTPVRVDLPPERRGLLTQAAVLAHEQGTVYTRPIQRSVYVLRRILCADLPPPPLTVDATPRASEPGSTTRETYASLTAQPACASCHAAIINPLGFAFEDFDAIGAHRTTERGQAIDASGGIPTLSITGLDGGASVGTAVAGVDELNTCFARQWLRYTLARTESQADATSLRAIADASRSGAPLRDVMLSVVTTYAFTHRTVPVE